MCGRCCRTSIVSLSAAEARHLEAVKPSGCADPVTRKYRTAAGESFRVEPRKDGSCPFLRGDGRCEIHAVRGPAAKPLACRLFPFSFVRTPRGMSAFLHFSCPAVALGAGDRLETSRRALESLAAEVEETAGVPEIRDTVLFDPGRVIAFEDLAVLRDHATRLLSESSAGPAGRIAAATEFAFLVSRSSVESASRFKYWEAIADGSLARFREGCSAPWPPNVVERMLLRQTAFALSAVTGQAALRAGIL
jgi:lysine-N-methylase